MLNRLLAGHYRVVQNLEEGGLAQTYIVEDQHRPGYPKCAVKFLKPASNQPDFLPTARRLFQQEAEILEKLGQHDQIPRLLAYFEENQEFYLVQEFIEGHTLSAELPRGHIWSENKVITMLQDVLQTLEFVHGYGVIHRDIKPNNLIRRKKDGRLVLIDFGAVKQVRAPRINDPSALTQYTIAIGTQGYMPTEQVRGKPRLNSDIYALGMIGIQALTGVHPLYFQEDEEGEIIWQDLAEASDELATILSNMVRYHFKDRYQSSTEVLEALQPFVEQSRTISANLSMSRWERESGSDLGQNQVVLGSETALSANSAAVVEPVATKIDSEIDSEVKELEPETELQKTKVIHKFDQSESENWQLWLILSNQFTKFSSWGLVSRARQLSCWRFFTQLLPQGKKLFCPSKLNLLVEHIPQWLQLNKSQLLVGTGITSATIGILTGYTYIDDSHLQTALEEIEILKTAGKYQECGQEAEILAQYYSSLQGKIASLQQKCEAAQAEAQLTAAKQLAAASRLKDAIALATEVPEDTELYAEAKQLIAQWSEQIFQIASNKYEEGDLPTAIAIAKAVPSDHPLADKVEATIQQWQEDWQQNQTYLKTAQEKLNRGRWQDAINTAQQISQTDYWQEQSQAIIQRAQAKIAAAQAAARKTYQPRSSSRSRTVPRSGSTVPRTLPSSLRSRSVSRPNSTSSSSRSVTSSTYTRSRAVNRSGSNSPRSKSNDWICLNNPNPKCRK